VHSIAPEQNKSCQFPEMGNESGDGLKTATRASECNAYAASLKLRSEGKPFSPRSASPFLLLNTITDAMDSRSRRKYRIC